MKNIRVTVGQGAVLNFQLALGTITDIIEVTADVPPIETTRSQQSNTIEEQYIRNLPIDRRDYLTFSLLAPGVADSNALADNTDFPPSIADQRTVVLRQQRAGQQHYRRWFGSQ